ncbi:MAG: hypothetical protein ABI895_08240 [Deltaproteobacteria bacterium]
MSKACANHPLEPALTVCSSCRRGLCSACWRHNVEKRSWCELCVHHLTSTGNASALAVVFFLLSVAVATWLLRRGGDQFGWGLWFCFGIAVCIITAVLARRGPNEHGLSVELRVEDSPALQPATKGGVRYRAVVLHASRLVASPVSGVWTTVVLLSCMTTVAIAIPWLLRLPKWIEAEAVVALWWAVWGAVLTTLLYRGWRLADDHVLAPPRAPWARPRSATRGAEKVVDGVDFVEALACGEGALLALLVAGLFVAAWLAVELVVPALFFFAYLLVRKSLARIANDHHGCERRWWRALAWGVLWSSAYALPLAASVFLAHRLWPPPTGLLLEMTAPTVSVAPGASGRALPDRRRASFGARAVHTAARLCSDPARERLRKTVALLLEKQREPTS